MLDIVFYLIVTFLLGMIAGAWVMKTLIRKKIEEWVEDK